MNNQLSIDRRHPFVWIALLLLAILVAFLIARCEGSSKSVQGESVIIAGTPLDPAVLPSDLAIDPGKGKALFGRGVRVVLFLDEKDQSIGALSLDKDGVYAACKSIGPTSDDEKPAYPNGPTPQKQGQYDVFPFSEAQVLPAASCPNISCGCGNDPRCRAPAGNCCKCT